MRRHPIYMILLEYNPMGLRAAGVPGLSLLRLLQHTLGYQCFETRVDARTVSPGPVGPARTSGPATVARRPRLSPTLEEFVASYERDRRGFGQWTDLLCVQLGLLR